MRRPVELVSAVVAVLVALTAGVAVVDTIGWSVFGRPVPAAEEIEGILLAWLALLAAAVGVAERRHIAFEVVDRWLSPRWVRRLDRVADMGVAIFGILLGFYGLRLLSVVHNTLPATGWPAAVQYLPAAVAGPLIALAALVPGSGE